MIEGSQYVLTLDYTMKMLNIHERRKCGVPVIIEGETGVGKTALVEMLSKLWNHSLIKKGTMIKGKLLSYIRKKVEGKLSSLFRFAYSVVMPNCYHRKWDSRVSKM